MSTSLMEDAFAHHVWATLRLVDTCLALSPEQMETAVPGTYGSILETLRHIIGSDAWDLFVATGDRAFLIDEEEMHLPELRAVMESHGPAWSRLLAQDLDPDALLDEVDEDDGYERHVAMSIQLAQVLHHGTDHRARSAPLSRRSASNRRASMSWTSACRRAGSWRSHLRPHEGQRAPVRPPRSGVVRSSGSHEGVMRFMDLDPVAAYKMYADAWNDEHDAAARRKLLERSWSPAGSLFDPETPEGVVGVDALVEYISDTHEEMPGLIVAETSEPEVLGNRLRVLWEARQNGERMYTGTDFVEFAEDGRVSRVTMFYDSAPG